MKSLNSFNRKKHQRRVNQYVRQINKNVANDDLWRGRFVMRQVGSPVFYIYEDKSGATLERVHLVITDLKTGREVHAIESSHDWCFWQGSKLWHFMNDAIVEYLDVWRKDSDPRDLRDNPDYDFNNPKVREMWKAHWKPDDTTQYWRRF